MVKRALRRVILWALEWNEGDLAAQKGENILKEWLFGGDD